MIRIVDILKKVAEGNKTEALTVQKVVEPATDIGQLIEEVFVSVDKIKSARQMGPEIDNESRKIYDRLGRVVEQRSLGNSGLPKMVLDALELGFDAGYKQAQLNGLAILALITDLALSGKWEQANLDYFYEAAGRLVDVKADEYKKIIDLVKMVT